MVADMSRSTLLTNSSFLGELHQEFLSRLVDLASVIERKKGDVLFMHGDRGDALYVVETGAVEISIVAASGKKLSLNVMKEGDVFGEIAVLDQSSRTATARVLTTSRLLRVSHQNIVELIERQPHVALELIRILCERLRWATEQLEDRSFLPFAVRLAKRLLFLCDQLPGSNDAARISQSELAEFLGASREITSKTLNKWREHGWVAISRGSIRIVDRSVIETMAVAHD
jgi:CRP-like cAMP-binding protein